MPTSFDPETGLPVPDANTNLNQDTAGPGEIDPNDHSLLAAIASTPHPDEQHPAAAPAPAPSAIDSITGDGPAPQEPAKPASFSDAAKVSSSSHGITDKGIAMAGKARGDVASQAKAYNDKLDAEYEAHKAQINVQTAKQKNAMAEIALANKDHLDEMAHINKQAMDFNQAAADNEMHAAAQAKAHGEQYMAAYQRDMAGVRLLAMQSGNPLGGLSTTQGLGLAAAAFAQGFLGARGININVTGQIDKWVDRSIQEHQQNIENQKGLAKENLTLYDLARQGAKDDWEARQRMRGFVIDGFKSQLQVEADKWGSATAIAEAKQKVAAFNQEQITNDITLRNGVVDREEKNFKELNDTAHNKAMESIQWATQAAEQRHQEREDKIKAEKPGKEAKQPLFLTNVGVYKKDANGKIISGQRRDWYIDQEHTDPGVVTQATKATGEAAAYFGGLQKNIEKLRSLWKGAEGDMRGPQWFRNQSGPKYRMYKQTLDYITELAQQKVTGAAAPEEQAHRIQSWLAQNNLLQHGSNAGLMDTFEGLARDGLESVMQNTPGVHAVPKGSLSEDAPLGSPESAYEAPSQASPDAAARTDARIYGEEPKSGPAAVAYGKAKNIDRNETAPGWGSKLTHDYLNTESPDSPLGGDIRGAAGIQEGHKNKFEAVDDLARLIVHSDNLDGWVKTHEELAKKLGVKSSDSPSETITAAENALTALAQDDSADISGYANYIHMQLMSNKDAVKTGLEKWNPREE